MQLNDFLARLKGVKRNGSSQYDALCPAHADKEQSLSVSEKDGKILLHCHAGCSTDSILGVLGLEMWDLFSEERQPYNPNNGKPKNEIAAVYDYKDLDGNIIHSTIRYSPKSFRQRRPDPDNHGKYIWKDVFKGISPILYNLQAVTVAIANKEPIFITEGEKDCESLAKLGYTATTCPMGAGKWHKAYSDMLAGAMAYIIADNDEAGSNHARDVAKSLVGKADKIYLIDLATAQGINADQDGTAEHDLPKGYDISDYIEAAPAEAKNASIELLLENATPYVPDEKKAPQGKGEKISGSGKPTKADMLMLIVEDSGATFFHSDVKDLYATMKVNGHNVIMAIGSKDFELWLIGLYYKAYAQPIGSEAIKQVLGACSAKAMSDCAKSAYKKHPKECKIVTK